MIEPMPALPPLREIKHARRATLQEHVYAGIRQSLIEGRLSPGEPLIVRELAEQADTSPMPVREALRRLVAEGALEQLPNGTVRVHLMDPASRRDSIEIRIALEGLAARKAADRVQYDEIVRLERIQTEINKCALEGDILGSALGNQRFHFAVYEIARSAILLKQIETLWAQNAPYLMQYTASLYSNPEALPGVYTRHHEDLIRSFKERDPAAAEAAIRADLQALLDYVGPLNSAPSAVGS